MKIHSGAIFQQLIDELAYNYDTQNASFIFAGKNLNQTDYYRTLEDIGIKNTSTIQMTYKLRGGKSLKYNQILIIY